MKICILASQMNRGPGKLYHNLVHGLRLLGHEVTDSIREADYTGCLQNVREIPALDKNALMGPNLCVLPSEAPHLFEKFKNFVVPSTWTLNLYRKFKELNEATINVWPVGIDTEIWQSKKISTPKKNILFYVKNRDADKQKVLIELSKFNINIAVIEYGNYHEKHLLTLCSHADGCVLLTGTESQGIAYMQILSCGIPCYVIDKNTWDYDGKYHEVPATSVPYFDESCGFKVSKFEDHSFNHFLNEIDRFDPRSFILKEHTLVASAKKYVDILVNAASH